jgi:hypothetical protein
MNKTNNKGLVTLIFILIIALIATLILIVGQSRLLVALQRGKSSSDVLLANYQAESEINDVLYKIVKGYEERRVFNYDRSLPGNFTLRVDSHEVDGIQVIDATSSRSFAVSKVRATIGGTSTTTSPDADLILALDCTGSLDARQNGQTLMSYLKSSALDFVKQIAASPTHENMHLGVLVFTRTQAWARTASGVEISPQARVPYSTIVSTLESGLGDTRGTSTLCNLVPESSGGNTNIGGAYVFAQNYFEANRVPNVNQVEVLITDGRPNRVSTEPRCPTTSPDLFLKCAITKTDTRWDATHFGIRNPEIIAYGVTVMTSPPSEVVTIFRNALGVDNYFNASNANQLSNILTNIGGRIIERQSVISIKRIIPEAQ